MCLATTIQLLRGLFLVPFPHLVCFSHSSSSSLPSSDLIIFLLFFPHFLSVVFFSLLFPLQFLGLISFYFLLSRSLPFLSFTIVPPSSALSLTKIHLYPSSFSSISHQSLSALLTQSPASLQEFHSSFPQPCFFTLPLIPPPSLSPW